MVGGTANAGLVVGRELDLSVFVDKSPFKSDVGVATIEDRVVEG